ncbi:MAG: hypothetical protein FWG14_05505 [Peptococcaceae bacterium]|nr:hypothetical protein [Peptococcaceae bacterium]
MLTVQKLSFWYKKNRIMLLKEGNILGYGDPHNLLSSENLTTLYNTEVGVGTLDVPYENGFIHAQTCVPIISKRREGEFEKEAI